MTNERTKLAVLRGYMNAEDWRAALKLASTFPRLGPDAATIRRGWEAFARPDFYRSIGREPTTMIREAVAALKGRYTK